MPTHVYPGLGEQHLVRKVGEMGLRVTLDDGSVWEVRHGDSSKTALWYPTQRIIVKAADDESYPYRLKNLDTYQEEEVESRLRR